MPDGKTLRIQSMIPGAYRELLRRRELRVPLLASVIGRLPYGAGGLALLILVQQTTGSFASAGAIEAAFTLGVGVGVPLQGRLIDHLGQTLVLCGCAALNAVVSILLVIAARGAAPLTLVAGAALLAGLTVPPISPCIRSLWADVLGDDEASLQTAYALDAVIIEFAFIIGPLVAAVLIAAASPEAAILASMALGCGGALAFAGSQASRQWRAAGVEERHWAGPLRSPGVLVLIAVSLFFGVAMSALELSVIAFSKTHASAALAGPLISAQGIASFAGGVWFGARRWASPLPVRFVRLNLLIAICFAPLILLLPVGWTAAAMFLTGFGLAPMAAAGNSLAGQLAPLGTRTEAFGWLITATVVGSGLGNVIGGAVVNGGHLRLGFTTAFASMAVAWLIARAGLRRLSSPSPQMASVAV